VVGGQDKTLLMWVRQEILARHTNQGKGSYNASACAALITTVLFLWPTNFVNRCHSCLFATNYELGGGGGLKV
jgi:hypothetical protein